MSLNFGDSYNEIVKIDKKPLIIPPLGFNNTGSICYFNSLMQCLLSSKNFLRTIIDYKPNDFIKFFLNLITENKWDLIFTTRLLAYYNMIQPNQSCSEYFVLFVDILKLDELFEIVHKITTTCKNCENTSEREDKSVNVLINNNIMEFFESSEEIEGYNCDKCKTKSTIIQQRKIHILSPIIAISMNKYFDKKLLQYPEIFDIYSAKYRLIGTIEHTGNLNAGHYVSRVFRDGKYYSMNDTHVSEINQLNPLDETYMLFYERIL